MRYSKAFIPTVKEAPKEATMPSHIFLLRAGAARMVGAGLYEFLPLGMRVLHRIANIVREEMNRSGAQEMLMPALLPATYFKESGRWDTFGGALVRLKDRKGGDYHLGPTHEEIITDLVRREVKSYRQLPLNLYQVQMKYRDEPRPRAGLLRCREFLMKDAYSFDVSMEAAETSYAGMRDAYHKIFGRLGLDYRIVEADSGAMGGSTSAEFQVLTQNGEDAIVACTSCDYAANVEVAVAKPVEAAAESTGLLEVEKIHTPAVKTIAKLVGFLGADAKAEHTLKSLLYVPVGDPENTEPVLVVLRGDHDANEIRVARELGVNEVRLASDKEVFLATGAKVGFVGPQGYKGKVLVDRSAAAVVNGVAGANEKDHHVKNVNFGRDFEGTVADVREVTDGDPCSKCGSALKTYRGIEGGHIFILGTHYSSKMGATFLNEAGESGPVVMGCYGIGVSRLLAASIEQHHDENGIVWPMAIAPFHAVITLLGQDDDVTAAGEKLYAELVAKGVDVLLDDRKARPGSKFKDADLLGIPLRITIGGRGIKSGEFEVKARTEKDPVNVAIVDVVENVRGRVLKDGGRLLPVD